MGKYVEAIDSSKGIIVVRRETVRGMREAEKERKANLALRRRQKNKLRMASVRDALESEGGSVISNESLETNMKLGSSSASRKRRGAVASIASDAGIMSQLELNALTPANQLLTVHCEVEDRGVEVCGESSSERRCS